MKGNILLIVTRVLNAVQNAVTISMEEEVSNSNLGERHAKDPFLAK